MKRLLAASLVFACAIGISPARGQPASESKTSLRDAKLQFLEAETRVGAVIADAFPNDFLDGDASTERLQAQREKLRPKLRPVAAESFDARQQMQHVELESLRRRLAEIEQAVTAREKNKETIVNARVESLLANIKGMQPPRGIAQTSTREQKEAVSDDDPNLGDPVNEQVQLIPEAAGDGSRTRDRSLPASHYTPRDGASSLSAFDPETRERLAQVDLQMAQEGYDAAEKELKRAEQLYATGAVPEAVLATCNKELRLARGQLDRAKVIVDGFTRQRGEEQAQTRIAAYARRSDPDAGEQLDFETRERLAHADVEEAQAIVDAARYDLEAHVDANKQAPGSTPKAELKNIQAKVRIAEAKLQRANVTLEGYERERAALRGAADAAVAEAEAEREKAAAKVRTCEADFEAAKALISEREVDVERATANYKYREKTYKRIKQLVEEKAVSQRLADEEEQHLVEAEASLAAAKAAVATAKANTERFKLAIDEAWAALKADDVRLGAAKAHRDRLPHRNVKGEPASQAPTADERQKPEASAGPNAKP